MCEHLSNGDIEAKVSGSCCQRSSCSNSLTIREDLKLQKTIKTLLSENDELKSALIQREQVLSNAGIMHYNSQPTSISPASATAVSASSAVQHRESAQHQYPPRMSEEIVTEARGSGGGSGRVFDIGPKRAAEYGDRGVHPAMSANDADAAEYSGYNARVRVQCRTMAVHRERF